ncbi:MAG: M67 family metallopeptidase [Chitinivibrionales bacterium]|nr:M67 family metallopeptidase [Chitinivibrionales bacterium]
MLRIKHQVVDALFEQAQKDAPLEACGYLAEKNGVVELHLPLKNIDASKTHFSLDPEEQFKAFRVIRSREMRLKAVYHSHPASPALPSPEDIRLAFDPFLSYVIVSLDKECSVKSFRIKAGAATEEAIEIV